jgi:hypothetical protein
VLASKLKALSSNPSEEEEEKNNFKGTQETLVTRAKDQFRTTCKTGKTQQT